MGAESTVRAKAWPMFDLIVANAAASGLRNPWMTDRDGQVRYVPDLDTLSVLLGIPLYLKAVTQSGVPALALDVWLSHELRRAGFDPDAVWPRPVAPRIIPASVIKLLRQLPLKERRALADRINGRAAIPGVTTSGANILGKNYIKQVDVVISDWASGPQLLISTKRMDSSYGKNAPNRIEESYGDAKNLRLRHPLAALGFVFGLRSDILEKEPLTAEWLFDLLAKLGREDDAYDATCLILMEYADAVSVADSGEEAPAAIVAEPGPVVNGPSKDGEEAAVSRADAEQAVRNLPKVKLIDAPPELSPARFLRLIVNRVLDATPVTMHKEARQRRSAPLQSSP